MRLRDIARFLGAATALAAPLVVLVSVEPEPRSYASHEDLVVQASVSTAGPHGQLWRIELAPDGELSVEIQIPQGTLKGSFVFPDHYWASLRRVIDEEQFFQLSPVVSRPTAPVHRPDLTIEVSLGGNAHKVSLYDPGNLKTDPEAERFMRVWNQLLSGLPVKPSW